jgi:hypothetical protein
MLAAIKRKRPGGENLAHFSICFYQFLTNPCYNTDKHVGKILRKISIENYFIYGTNRFPARFGFRDATAATSAYRR